MSEKDTGKAVYSTLDPENPPTMSAEDWARFDAITDDQIDFSDAPATTNLSRFKPVGNFEEHLKQRILASKEKAERAQAEAHTEDVPVARDILQFFRESGDAPTRINSVLRDYITAQRKSA